MATYTMICDQGHEPETMTVEANSDEEAMTMMMEKSKAHNSVKHPGMAMTDDEMKAFITSHWAKS